jgi:hypothetical protein
MEEPMKAKMIAVAAVLLVGIQVGAAQTPSSSPAQTPTPPDEIATLSQQWMEAAQQHDTPGGD